MDIYVLVALCEKIIHDLLPNKNIESYTINTNTILSDSSNYSLCDAVSLRIALRWKHNCSVSDILVLTLFDVQYEIFKWDYNNYPARDTNNVGSLMDPNSYDNIIQTMTNILNDTESICK